jgi:Cu(I)/Ag(I) efflux system membrane fusion protein
MTHPADEALPSDEEMERSRAAGTVRDSTPEAPGPGGGKIFWVAVQILQVRLRFILLLAALGLAIGYWGTLRNYWDKWTRPPRAAGVAAPQEIEYYCPMHPQVVRAEMGNCPICGMPLSKRKKGETAEVHLPPGVLSRTQYSPYRIALAGIHTSEVRYRSLTKKISTVGYVDYDQTRRSQIVLRAAGYVEKLYVDQTWVRVDQGTPLAEVYSPELYSTAEELLIATEGGRTEGLARSAREKLRLLGVSPEEIAQIERSRRVSERLLIRSPRQGYVIAKDILEGRHVAQGQTIYEIADLGVVWIEADIYEKDIALLRPGLEVFAAAEAFPNQRFQGRVSVVYQQINPATRTERVRFEIQNPDDKLRPGMYATVQIHVPLTEIEPFRAPAAAGRKAGEVLAVPGSAVIDTGEEKVVYVESEPGAFDGVAVKVGPRCGDYYPVISGLAPGDRVATAGAFLLDAETRLNPAAAAEYFGARGGPQSEKKHD